MDLHHFITLPNVGMGMAGIGSIIYFIRRKLAMTRRLTVSVEGAFETTTVQYHRTPTPAAGVFTKLAAAHPDR